MSTTPPSDPWSTPPDRPDEPEPDQPTLDQAAPRDPSDQPGLDQPSAPVPPRVPYGEQRPKPTPPSPVLTAVKLMYVGAALSAIGFLTSLLTQDSIREQALERNATLTESELDAIVSVGIAIGVVIGLIGILLWVWMAETNRRGKSWARIVATVLGALNIMFTVISLVTQQYSGIVVIFNLISAALAAGILYLLYRPDSNAYYESVSALRR